MKLCLNKNTIITDVGTTNSKITEKINILGYVCNPTDPLRQQINDKRF